MTAESKGTTTRNWVELPTVGPARAGGALVSLMFARVLVANTADFVDLTTIDWQDPAQSDDPTRNGQGAADTFVTILVDGILPVYVIGGPTQASVTGGNVPVIATVGTNVAAACWPIYPTPATGPPTGVEVNRFLVRRGVNHFLGFISTGTPTLRIYRSGLYMGK